MSQDIPYTVLGGAGFIGKALAEFLRGRGHTVYTPARKLSSQSLCDESIGHVVYCIGLTADFRSRPWDTLDAHVGVLRHLLAEGSFSSLTYLSSTRVYLGSKMGCEDAVVQVSPEQPDQLYNLSKLMGEALCHTASRPDRPVRVVRLSNVVGGDLNSDNFIYSLMREALSCGVINLNSSLDSAKDYIALIDVLEMLELVASKGKSRCYNLASGRQVTNRDVVQLIADLTGAEIKVSANAVQQAFPVIDISRLSNEFGFSPSSPFDDLPSLLFTESSYTAVMTKE